MKNWENLLWSASKLHPPTNHINLQTFGDKFRVGPYVTDFSHNLSFIAVIQKFPIHDNYTVNFA